jgi:hypothetical protein
MIYEGITQLTPEQVSHPHETFREHAVAWMIRELGPEYRLTELKRDSRGRFFAEFVWPNRPAWVEKYERLKKKTRPALVGTPK